jgi:hypothetical protein
MVLPVKRHCASAVVSDFVSGFGFGHRHTILRAVPPPRGHPSSAVAHTLAARAPATGWAIGVAASTRDHASRDGGTPSSTRQSRQPSVRPPLPGAAKLCRGADRGLAERQPLWNLHDSGPAHSVRTSLWSTSQARGEQQTHQSLSTDARTHRSSVQAHHQDQDLRAVLRRSLPKALPSAREEVVRARGVGASPPPGRGTRRQRV